MSIKREFQNWLAEEPSRKKNLPAWKRFLKTALTENEEDIFDDEHNLFTAIWSWPTDPELLGDFLEYYRVFINWFRRTAKKSNHWLFWNASKIEDALIKIQANQKKLTLVYQKLDEWTQLIKELKC